MMEILPFGDSGALINFTQEINLRTNEEVVACTSLIEQKQISGVITCIPGYCSITIHYDPQIIQYDSIVNELQQVLKTVGKTDTKPNRTINLPVCYDDPFALDLQEVSDHTGVDTKDIIKAHTSKAYRVFMIGFLPGFTYMGILPKKLECPRKSSPRLKVPGRSVGLAGLQTGIYPMDAPGGWQIIGQTPIDIFDGHRDHPFLFETGDQVHFNPINDAKFFQLREEVESGRFQMDQLYG